MVARAVESNGIMLIGAPVYDRDGRRIGKVVSANNADLRIECGLFFRQTYCVSLGDVDRVEDGRVILGVSRDEAMDD